MKDLNLLMVGDSPTVFTGFANVIRNLALRFSKSFNRVDIWGINYNGWPHELPYKIFPAGFNDWNSANKLSQLLNLIHAGDYTHVFILTDCHNFGPEFAEHLKRICKEKGIRTTFYYPVDAPLERNWLDTVAAVDVPVTYTEYGRTQTRLARPGINPAIIPHGVDTSVYNHCTSDRIALRRTLFKGWVKDQDFLILNVNRNERRKAPQHSLQILKRLRDMKVRAKLLMHCTNVNHQEGTSLEMVGAQLGTPHGIDWRHSDPYFHNGNSNIPESGLNQIYNCADLVLSTSLAEGWGLSVTEGAAAGCRIAVPDNTSLGEIGRKFKEHGQNQIELLPLSANAVVNPLDSSRVRYPVDVEKATNRVAEMIAEHRAGAVPDRYSLNPAVKEWLSWDRIAGEFLKLMLK